MNLHTSIGHFPQAIDVLKKSSPFTPIPFEKMKTSQIASAKVATRFAV